MLGLSFKEWTFAGLIGLLIFIFGSVQRGWEKQKPIFIISESYEMTRPKNISTFERFDLSGRQVESRLVGGPVQPVLVTAQGNHPITPAVPGKNNGKAAAKKVDPKKQAQLEAQKKKAQAEAKRKSQLKVTMLGQSRTGLSANTAQNQKTSSPHAEVLPQVAMPPQAVASTPADKEEDDPKLSAGQWLSLLQNQPTGDKLASFKKAKSYLGNKAYYYDVIAKLLLDSQPDRQAFAFTILKTDVSSPTFYFLCNPTEEIKKQTAVYEKLGALFAQYKGKAQFGILNYALSIENPNSNLEALTILTELSGKVQSRSPTQTESGAGQVAILKIDDFKMFETALKRLAKNANTQIAQDAKSLYTVIWPSATVVAGTP